jgi:hypothetical protein
MLRAFWIAASALALTACAGSRAMQSGVAHSGWPVLAPASLGATRTVNQVLRVAFGERESTLNCVVAVDAKQLTIVGTTALGMRVFTVKHDGAKIEASVQPGAPATLPPERLLNDVQFVYWPLSALQSAMRATEWQVSEPVSGTRRLRRGDKIVAEAHFANEAGASEAWNGRAWLVNLEFGYTLQIDSRPLTNEQ